MWLRDLFIKGCKTLAQTNAPQQYLGYHDERISMGVKQVPIRMAFRYYIRIGRFLTILFARQFQVSTKSVDVSASYLKHAQNTNDVRSPISGIFKLPCENTL